MKAGDLFMIQYCADHGSFRVLPLRTCEDLARLDMDKGDPHAWVVIGHASNEGDALEKMKAIKANISRRDAESAEGKS